MKDVTLVVMAAGIGSRYKGGIKQLEEMGPNGEIIMDYSIYDALQAGFNKVVFVIRKDLEEEFDEVIGQRIRKKTHVEYAFQELDDISEKYQEANAKREKPWGTGQAILACKDLIHEPFLVINADDYYGKEAYRKAYDYLTSPHEDDRLQGCMVGFVLQNTLSENGAVTRGLCRAEGNKLVNIVETKNIRRVNGVIKSGDNSLDDDSIVSMNMWGLYPEMFEVLEKRFDEFLNNLDEGDLKSEYLLPTIIGDLLEEDKIDIEILRSNDAWFGVTFQEDKQAVKENIKELIKQGYYPKRL